MCLGPRGSYNMVAPTPPAPPPEPPAQVSIAAPPVFAKAVEKLKQTAPKTMASKRRSRRQGGKSMFTIKPPVNYGGGGTVNT